MKQTGAPVPVHRPMHVDKDLIEGCLIGDQTAWTKLVERYERLIYSVARTICAERADASDVFQQVWLELYRQLPDLRQIEALPAWLITVTRRRAAAIMRRKHRDRPLDMNHAVVCKRIAAIEAEYAVERALSTLPDRCRQLIELLYFEVPPRSYEEISQLLGMPVPSIGPTRARCLQKLRTILS